MPLSTLSSAPGLGVLLAVALLALAVGLVARAPRHRGAAVFLCAVVVGLVVVPRFGRGPAPDDAYVVRAHARTAHWELEHPDGLLETELYVPVGHAVQLATTATDAPWVYVSPALGIGGVAWPGRFSSTWFEAAELSRAPVYAWTPSTPFELHVLEITFATPEEMMDRRIVCRLPLCDEPPCPPEVWGELLFSQKGCTACHAREDDAPQLAGPSLQGLYGRESRMADGSVVVVDEAYVRESLLDPGAHVVEGFAPVMPKIRFSDEQLETLLDYLETL